MSSCPMYPMRICHDSRNGQVTKVWQNLLEELFKELHETINIHGCSNGNLERISFGDFIIATQVISHS
jgi:hypothetical protein